MCWAISSATLAPCSCHLQLVNLCNHRPNEHASRHPSPPCDTTVDSNPTLQQLQNRVDEPWGELWVIQGLRCSTAAITTVPQWPSIPTGGWPLPWFGCNCANITAVVTHIEMQRLQPLMCATVLMQTTWCTTWFYTSISHQWCRTCTCMCDVQSVLWSGVACCCKYNTLICYKQL